MQAYVAELSFQEDDTPGNREVGTTIRFLAPSPRDAALGVARWWDGRHEAFASHFHRLLCVKLYTLDLQEFTEDGYLHPETGLHIFEWKIDTSGASLLRYVDHKLPAT